MRWANASEHLVDHWENIRRGCGGEPIDLHGAIGDVVVTFERVPSGRLVVLGRAGAGKSVLAVRFVLALLATDRWSTGGPVPWVFPLASWDPTVWSLRDWLVRELIRNDPWYTTPTETGTTAAAELVDSGRLLPVLDGLDEMADGLRAEALRAINVGLRPADQLLLTSRPDEYAAAVKAGDVLTAAAVVELEGLSLDELASYLPWTTRRVAQDERMVTKWDPVLAELRRDRAGGEHQELRTALQTPLMVALARTVYSDTDADPVELLDRERFPNQQSVEAHLLDALIPALYYAPARTGERLHRTWAADDAALWLAFIANQMQGQLSRELVWWRLCNAVPALLRGTVVGVIGAVLILLLVFGVGLTAGLWDWLDYTNYVRRSIAAGDSPVVEQLGPYLASNLSVTFRDIGWLVLFAIVPALAVKERGWVYIALTAPTPMRWRLRRRRERVRNRLTTTFVVGGIVLVLSAIEWNEEWPALLVGRPTLLPTLLVDLAELLVAAVAAMLTWIAAGLVAPVRTGRTADPITLLRLDRATGLGHGLVIGTVVGTCTGLAYVLLWSTPILFGLFFGLFAGVFAGVYWVFAATAWGQWIPTRIALATLGHLPWSTLDFLEDARRRGVLRRTGAAYQFRHALLQDHLATRAKRKPPPDQLSLRWYKRVITRLGWPVMFASARRLLGPTHPFTLAAQLGLVLVQWNQGRFSLAERNLRTLLRVWQEIADEDEQYMVRFVRQGLAELLVTRGPLDDAEPEVLGILAVQRSLLGADHPLTLMAQVNLAKLFRYRGRFAKAETEATAALALLRHALGPDHSETLSAELIIAEVLLDTGYPAPAETRLRDTLTKLKRALGNQHSLTLTARADLAQAVGLMGRRAEAEAELRTVLQKQRRKLRKGHPDILDTQQHLGSVLAAQHRYDAAEAELRSVLKGRLRIQHGNHPAVLGTRTELAGVLVAQGRHDETVSELKDLLAAQQRVLDSNHSMIRRTEELLGVVQTLDEKVRDRSQ